jgi:hypothetical protein
MQTLLFILRRGVQYGGEVATILLVLLAVVCVLNPFSAVIQATAQPAQPVEASSPSSPAPDTPWCLAGDFQAWQPASHPMNDAGQAGDADAGDGIFSLQYTIPEPGRYTWKVIECENEAVSFPVSSAWLYTREVDRPVTFTLDTNLYEDAFWPKQFIVNATDDHAGFTAVGDFQGWVNDSPDSAMYSVGSGLYRLVYTIESPGFYTGLIVATGTWDGYQAIGRSEKWVNWQIRTSASDEQVIFFLDTRTGRVSILTGLLPGLTWLAYWGGSRKLGSGLFLMGIVVGSFMLRTRALNNRRLWVSTGCPRCYHKPLRRVHRKTAERLLSFFSIPTLRADCPECGWQGTRINDEYLY